MAFNVRRTACQIDDLDEGELVEVVKLCDGGVYLQLWLDDLEVTDWLRRIGDSDQQLEAVKRALKVGVVAMSSALVGSTSQTIREAIGRWRAEVESALSESREQIVREITEQFGHRVAQPIEARINGITNDAVGRIRERLDELERRIDPTQPDSWLRTVQGVVDALRGEFDPTHEGSYLWRVRDILREYYGRNGEATRCISEAVGRSLGTVQEVLQQLQKDVDQIKVRLGGVTTQKGWAFEKESVGELLRRVVSVTQDQCDHVGEDRRPGDWLITVRYGGISGRQIGCIVVEAKDSKMDKPKVQSSLGDALKIREADVGILIFANREQNPYDLPFTVLDDKYTKMVCEWDEEGLNFGFAYQLARLCILENYLRTLAPGVDWTNLRQQVQDVLGEVQRLDELVRCTRLAKKHAEEAEGLSNEIKDNLLKRIRRLQEAIDQAASA
jgi:hypothetical protein